MLNLPEIEANTRTHIVMMSGGVSSFEAARRTVNVYGRERVELWFADTNAEDEDLYRFLRDASLFLGVPLKTFSDGRSVWELFHQQGMMGNSRIDLCSRILKRELLERERKKRFAVDDCISVFGFDWTEPHRILRVIKLHSPYICSFPLNDKPYLLKSQIIEQIRRLGLEPPRLYSMGFQHNNCGGACVKGGHAAWAHLLKNRPHVFKEWENNEELFRANHGVNVSILRDRTGGVTKPLPLKEFRKRVEMSSNCGFDFDDWGACSCFSEPPQHEGGGE